MMHKEHEEHDPHPAPEHPGTEFIYLLRGELLYRHGRRSYALRPGDALTFRGDIAHGPLKLIRVPIRMLSIIIYGDNSEARG